MTAALFAILHVSGDKLLFFMVKRLIDVSKRRLKLNPGGCFSAVCSFPGQFFAVKIDVNRAFVDTAFLKNLVG